VICLDRISGKIQSTHQNPRKLQLGKVEASYGEKGALGYEENIPKVWKTV
jgi:hypothetical protein